MMSWLRIWGWAVAGGLLLSLMMATQAYVSGFIDWAHAFAFAATDVLPWALLFPFILKWAARVPLDRQKWPLSVSVHLLTALLCALVVPALSYGVTASMHLPSPNPPGGPGIPMMDLPPPPGPPDEMGPDLLPPWLHFALFRAQFNFPAYWIILLGWQGWSFYRQAQERGRRTAELEVLLSQARLQNLRTQLHPHFLFNALHALSELVHSAPDRADEMIASLSELLRLSLRDSGRAEIPLREELEALDCYLEIQQLRFGDRLKVERKIDPETLAAMVPSFFLQPLVENVVKHVLERRNQPVHVCLQTSRQGGQLMLRLLDDGPGLGVENRPPVEGVGLGNARARLAGLYGTAQSLVLRNRAEGGLDLSCTLPFCAAASEPVS